MFRVRRACDLGAGFEKQTLRAPYVHVHVLVHAETMTLCAMTFLWFNREVRVVMGAVDDNTQANSSHTTLVHCATCVAHVTARRPAFGLQPTCSLGHGTGLHVLCTCSMCFFAFCFLFFFRTPSLLLAG